MHAAVKLIKTLARRYLQMNSLPAACVTCTGAPVRGAVRARPLNELRILQTLCPDPAVGPSRASDWQLVNELALHQPLK